MTFTNMMAFRPPFITAEDNVHHHPHHGVNFNSSPPSPMGNAVLIDRLSNGNNSNGFRNSEVNRLGLANIEARMARSMMAARMAARQQRSSNEIFEQQQQQQARFEQYREPQSPGHLQSPVPTRSQVHSPAFSTSPGLYSPAVYQSPANIRGSKMMGGLPHTPTKGLDLLRSVSIGLTGINLSDSPAVSRKKMPHPFASAAASAASAHSGMTNGMGVPKPPPHPFAAAAASTAASRMRAGIHQADESALLNHQHHPYAAAAAAAATRGHLRHLQHTPDDSPEISPRSQDHRHMQHPFAAAAAAAAAAQLQDYDPDGAYCKSPVKTGSQRLYIDDIREWDVLCGRGGRSNHHPGNKRYRHVVSEMKNMYRNTEAKAIKTDLSRAIVDHVCNYGGRFVKKDEQTGRYYVLTKAEARKKTSQALRETKELKWTF